MEEYATKIATLRKSKNMTQADLGKILNVTPQAVSKWEKGESQPDFETLTKLCETFGVTADYLLGRKGEDAVATTVVEKVVERVVEPAPQQEPKIINGYCEICKKPVGPGEYEVQTRRGGQSIYCKDCYSKKRRSERVAMYSDDIKGYKRGFIWGGVAAGVSIIVGIILAIVYSQVSYFLGSLAVAYFANAFVSELFWGGSVCDVFLFFLKSFRMPGVIFDLSLDGLIFLITVKLGLAILSIALSIVWFLIGCIFSPIYAGIIYIGSLLSVIKEWNDAKNGIAKS